MKTKLIVVFSALLALASFTPAQQNYLGQTTLAAAVAGNILGQGPSGSTAATPNGTLIQVTSATSITGIAPVLAITAAQSSQSYLFIDREFMRVVAVNGTTLTVDRGQRGTVAAPHSSGAMVLFGPARFFYDQDPGAGIAYSPGGVSHVPCLPANAVVQPWLNIHSGSQWVCNPNSNTWEPGYNNPLLPLSPSYATVASVAGATNVGGPVFKVSGTNAITSWTFTGNQNVGVAGAATANSQSAQFCVIPTGAFTYTATNNIGAAGTSVVGVLQCWQWNGPDGKWYPTAP